MINNISVLSVALHSFKCFNCEKCGTDKCDNVMAVSGALDQFFGSTMATIFYKSDDKSLEDLLFGLKRVEKTLACY